MKLRNLVQTAWFVLPLLTGSVIAQEGSAREEPMEEILVTGERTRSGMRFQIDRAQDDIYRLFNELLDERDYKVHCRSESGTGSYIIRRSCEPAFFSNARARISAQTMAAMRDGEDPQLAMEIALATGRVSDRDLKFDLGARYEEMNQKMFDLAQSNPELQQAMLRFAALKAEYDALLAAEQAREAEQRCERLFGRLLSRSCRQGEQN